MKWMAAGLLAMGAVGCAGAGQTYAPSKPAAVFPSRAELEAIAPKEVTAESFDLGNVQVETWNYGAAAGPDGPYEDTSPWAPILGQIIQAAPPGQLRLSGALRCAAEETARFHLKHGSLPSMSWRRFTAARCGSPSPNVMILSNTFDLPEGVTDAQVVARMPANFAYEMAKPLHSTSRHVTAGLAAVRDGKRLAVGIVFARDTVQVDASSYRADAQRRVTVRGTLVGEPAEQISGLINLGRYGVAPCEADREVAPPAFELSCQMAEGDKWAWIDLTARAKDRVLSNQVGSVMVLAAGEELPIQYGAPRGAGAPSVVRTPAEFRSALASRLNAVRGAARLSPLQLSAEQSTINERLVGVLLDTESKDAAKGNWSDFGSTADRAAIGVMAGWEVRGLIRDGTVFVASAPETRDATAWLDFAIEHPMGRATLLAPESRVVAIGPAVPKSANALGAVVTTYALFEGDDHSAEAERVFSAISSARTQRGLPAPVRLTNVPGLAEQTALVRAGKKAPSAAFHETLEYIAEHLPGERIQGLSFETLDVNRLIFPKELFRAGPMQLVVEVTHHRAPGAAWGQYVVYMFLRSSAGKAGYDARADGHHAAF
ncbi:hypothetical protein LVJ94_30125 [Pendulispora rubella]|uniref:Lipoprotein n=1 Tax=Pendulispora rubella TaxID=2741070 RepID=A0ABZ2KR81_9BACT